MIKELNLKKYHLLLISLLTGVLMSVAWPVRGFPFISFIGFVPFLFISDYVTSHKGFNRFAGLAYTYPGFILWNLLTTWWVYISTQVGFVLAMGLNSLFMSMVFGLYSAARRFYGGKNIYPLLLILWISFEYLHLDWDLSWSWLNLGNVFAAWPEVYQWYEYTGTFGGTLWVFMVNILVYETFIAFLDKKAALKKKLLTSSIIIAVCVPLIISLAIYSTYKEKKDPRTIVVVQPNIDPYNEKFGEMTTYQQLNKLIRVGMPFLDSVTDYLVCPETAIPDGLWEDRLNDYESIQQLRMIIHKYPGLKIVIGASTFGMFNEKNKSATARKYSYADFWYDVFNTALQIDSTDRIQIYHKSKLVPGVEKMPFPKLLKPLEKFAIKLGGMSGSHGIQKERTAFVSAVDHVRAAPVICYESIYGEFTTGYIKNGADFIFIITNDGWWGNTAGHRHHLQYARLRAVETRRSIARSANTGISAFINQRGDILLRTSWWEPVAIKEKLNANDKLTFYVKHGDYIGRISWIAVILFTFFTLLSGIFRYFKYKKD